MVLNTKIMGLLFCIFHCSPANEIGETITMRAFGRAFRLGSLYNRKTESIVGGGIFSLWNYEHLNKYTVKEPAYDTTFEAVNSETLALRKNLFGLAIGASMELGPIIIEGKISYDRNEIDSNYVANVRMVYEKRLFRKRISPKLVEKLDYTNIFERFPEATHVVTEIIYGGNAIFNFKRTVDTDFEKNAIELTLTAAADFIIVSISGSISIKVNIDKNKTFSLFDCKFVGDLELDVVPNDFYSAMELLKKLPGMINDNTAVPISVVMVPISLFDNKEQRMLRELNKKLIKSINNRLKNFRQLKLAVGDLLLSSAYKTMQIVKRHVDSFKVGLAFKSSKFNQQIVQILPRMKAKGGAEGELAKILSDEGDYTYGVLNSWIYEKSAETAALNTLGNWGKSLFLVKPGEKQHLIWNPSLPYLALLVLKLYHATDHFTDCFKKEKTPGCTNPVPYVSWLRHGAEIRHTIANFYGLIEAVKSAHSTKNVSNHEGNQSLIYEKDFKLKIVLENLKDNESIPTGVIELYKGGDIIDANAQVPQINNLAGYCLDSLHDSNGNYLDIYFHWDSTKIMSELYGYNYSFVVYYKHKVNSLEINNQEWSEPQNVTVKNNSVVLHIWKELFKHYQKKEDTYGYDNPFIEIRIVRECIFVFCSELSQNFTMANLGISWIAEYNTPIKTSNVPNGQKLDSFY